MLENKKKLIWLLMQLLISVLLTTQCRAPTAGPVAEQPTVQSTHLIVTPTAQFTESSTSTTSIPLATSTFAGGRIVFVSNRDGNDEIYVMNEDGSQQTRLTNNSASDRSPAWSPDGQHIAFVSYRDGNFEIYVMNADGSGQVNLTQNPSLDGQPNWSPDGKQIAFVSDRDGNFEIYVMNEDGSQPTNLTIHPAIDGDPAWSPDGQHIAFSSTRGNREDVVFINSELYLMNPDGSLPTRLTEDPTADLSPVWSPDGKYIAFISERDSVRGRVQKLYLMDVASREVTRLTTDDMAAYPVPHEFSPTWSPDGQFIVFSLDDGSVNIYSINIADGQLLQLTNTGSDHSPDWWSPGQ